MKALMEENKLEVTEKIRFEYRDKSKLIALYRNFGLSGFLLPRNQIHNLPIGSLNASRNLEIEHSLKN